MEKLIYPERLANAFKGTKEKYRPPNGTEGDIFMSHYCYQCQKDINNDCEIITRTMAFDVDHKEYPEEWIYNDQGQPECTAFVQK